MIDQGDSIIEATASVGITDKFLYNWIAKHKKDNQEDVLSSEKRAELIKLRKENKRLQISMVCRAMQVSTSAYYEWCKRLAKVFSVETLRLFCKAKALL